MKKNIKIKELICDTLNGRRNQERAIIGLFFKEKNGRFYPGKFNNMYKTIIKNLKKMDDKKLDEVYHGVVDTKDKLLIKSAVQYIKNTKNGK